MSFPLQSEDRRRGVGEISVIRVEAFFRLADHNTFERERVKENGGEDGVFLFADAVINVCVHSCILSLWA